MMRVIPEEDQQAGTPLYVKGTCCVSLSRERERGCNTVVVRYRGARLRLDVYCGVTKQLLRGIGSTLKKKAGPSFVHVSPRKT